MNIAYIRVSTREQNESRQVEALSKYAIEKTYIEKVSGKNVKDRTELKAMLDFCREGDCIYIHDFSRLARSTRDLLDIVNYLNDKGVKLVSNKENLDTSSATGRLMLSVIASINEFERENMLERQAEGIQIAKREGKYKGRKQIQVDKQKFDREYEKYMSRKISKSQMAINLNISRPTLDRLLKERVA